MVNYAFQPDDTPITPPDESEKLSTTIKLSEVLEAGTRLEASAFSIRNEIGNLVLKANQLRDEAWQREQEAIGKLENLIARKPATTVSEGANPNKVDLTQIKYDAKAIPIWELAAQLSAKVPEEEWEKVPADLAQRFDYYQGVTEDS